VESLKTFLLRVNKALLNNILCYSTVLNSYRWQGFVLIGDGLS